MKKYFSEEDRHVVKRASKRCQHQPWLGLRWLEHHPCGLYFWVLGFGFDPGLGCVQEAPLPPLSLPSPSSSPTPHPPSLPSPSPSPSPSSAPSLPPHSLSKISKHITYSWVDNKKMSTLLITKEIQIKGTKSYPFTSTGVAKRASHTAHVGKDLEKREPSDSAAALEKSLAVP